MSKRNSKSSNVSGVVAVRCTALKMGAFSSSCSKVCNEWSLMSVRRAEALKRTWESTGTMRESIGTGHTAGDHVLVTAILSAIFIVVLIYLLVLGQIQALRASWDPLLDSNKRQVGPCSVAGLLCTCPPRAFSKRQGGKKILKLPNLQILVCALVTHSLLSVKVCLGLAIFCVP